MVLITEIINNQKNIFRFPESVTCRRPSLGEPNIKQVQLPYGIIRLDILPDKVKIHVENLYLKTNPEVSVHLVRATFDLLPESSVNLTDGLDPPLRRYQITHLSDQI